MVFEKNFCHSDGQKSTEQILTTTLSPLNQSGEGCWLKFAAPTHIHEKKWSQGRFKSGRGKAPGARKRSRGLARIVTTRCASVHNHLRTSLNNPLVPTQGLLPALKRSLSKSTSKPSSSSVLFQSRAYLPQLPVCFPSCFRKLLTSATLGPPGF